MSTSYKEDFDMNSTVNTKTVTWEIDGINHTIYNVPYSEYNDEDYYDIDVSLNLAMIKDLMIRMEIPNEIDYNDVSDLNIT